MNFYNISVKKINGETIKLEEYKNKNLNEIREINRNKKRFMNTKSARKLD